MPDRQAGSDRTTPFERFFETAADLLCIVGRDGCIHKANPAWRRILGWPLEDVCGQPLLGFVHPDDVAATSTTLAALGRSELVDRLVNRCRHREGGWRWLEWTPVTDREDGLIYSTARDVTDERRVRTHSERIERFAGVGGWEVDLERGCVSWSPVTCAIHGVDGATPPHLDEALRFYPAAARAKLEPAFARLKADGTPYDLELPFIAANGARRWIRTTGAAEISDGHVVRVHGTIEDITAARRNKLRFAEILRAIGAGTWEWHVPTGEYRINDQWAKLLGFTPAELEPITVQTWESLCHPEDMSAVTATLDRHFSGETAEYQQQLRMRRRDGCWTWVLDTGRVVSWQDDGTPDWMVGAIIDINAQKADAAALARRDAMLCAVAASAGRLLNGGDWQRETNRLLAALGLAAEADRAYVFLTCDGAAPCARVDQIAEWCAPGVNPEIGNPALQGFDMAGAGLGRWIDTFLDGNPIIANRPEELNLSERAILEPQGITAICAQPLISDGRLEGFVGFDICGRPVLWSQPVLDALSAGAHLIGAGLAMARTHADLVAARERAEAASQTKSLFLANMSHEIRTPMNGVLGMAAVLDAALTDPAHRRMLGVIRESGQLLLGLLNDILDLSKIEAGRLTLESEPFVPADVARKIEALHRPRAAEKGLALTVQASPDAQRARYGDSQRMMQILHNLVGNALKFTERGTVTVGIGDIEGGATDRDDALMLTVRDTGIGMTPDQIARVFDDFVQADASTTRRFGGTGLGMSIVRRLVAAMEGTIAVESEPGKGTTVLVSLPLPLADVAPIREDPPSVSPMATAAPVALRVLAAEDNAINRLVLQAMLARLGAQVTMVEDGRAALAAWAPGRFDALLLDISMPVMDGVAALAAIRAAEAAAGCRQAPAIAVTAHALTHEVDRYLASGFDFHVAKPIEPETLERTLRALAIADLHGMAAGS